MCVYIYKIRNAIDLQYSRRKPIRELLRRHFPALFIAGDICLYLSYKIRRDGESSIGSRRTTHSRNEKPCAISPRVAAGNGWPFSPLFFLLSLSLSLSLSPPLSLSLSFVLFLSLPFFFLHENRVTLPHRDRPITCTRGDIGGRLHVKLPPFSFARRVFRASERREIRLNACHV